ncbi:hypothetical protein ACP3TD_09530 [Pseudarthrobacter sp. 1G09]|uniref:hypothetical protein n=1 Tax=Pseudarthrobacter sp. 1G09 TaxID=3416178 RepID=UPI003CF6AC38
MIQSKGRRSRKTPPPVDPTKFVHIYRPSNSSLRGAVVVGWALSIGAGAILGACILLPFSPTVKTLYLVGAIIGATLGGAIYVYTNLREGRRRREDFVRTGGDPTGISDMMFGVMRGKRTQEGNWIVPEQGSGDYQGT